MMSDEHAHGVATQDNLEVVWHLSNESPQCGINELHIADHVHERDSDGGLNFNDTYLSTAGTNGQLMELLLTQFSSNSGRGKWYPVSSCTRR